MAAATSSAMSLRVKPFGKDGLCRDIVRKRVECERIANDRRTCWCQIFADGVECEHERKEMKSSDLRADRIGQVFAQHGALAKSHQQRSTVHSDVRRDDAALARAARVYSR